MGNPATEGAAQREVLFMMTCLCDAFYADVAKAAVEVLEHAGCHVRVPEDQTCCGQPPFNGGDFETSRGIVRHTAAVFQGALPIVVPSGSCAAMHQHGNALQFEGEDDREAIASMGHRTWELFDFLVREMGIRSWPGHLRRKIAIHHSCHTRGSQSGAAIRQLLGSIDGIELVEFGQEEQCCGFGGTFSVTFPNISSGMGQLKLEHILAEAPDVLVSGDMSCLMHLNGLASKAGRPIPHCHAVEILAEALKPT